jgi:hypothetical protein
MGLSRAGAQPAPRKADRTFDEDQPAQLIEGRAAPDLVIRREGPAEAGHLQSLLAFATLYDDREILDQKKTASSASPVPHKADKSEGNAQQKPVFTSETSPKPAAIPGRRVSREQISLILLDGKSPPAEPPAMPPDEDSVLLDSGEVVIGMVMVTGGQVYVGGRGVPIEEVTMIRLKQVEKTDPIPAREKKDPPPPPTPHKLSPFWYGTVIYRGHVEHDSGDPECKGNYESDTMVLWKMAFTEKLLIYNEDMSKVDYKYHSVIQLDPNAEHQSIQTAFCMNWGLYRFENHRSLSCMSWGPDPYKIEDVYKPTEFDRSQPSSEPVLGHAWYYSDPLEEKLTLRHSQNPDIIPFKIHKSGSYDFITPAGLNGLEQAWPRQTAVDLRDGIPFQANYPDPFGIGTTANLESPSFEYHTMMFNYQRMYGTLQYRIGEDREIVFSEWDFHRVDSLPERPKLKKKTEEQEEDCEDYRKQMQDSETRYNELDPQIGKIVSQYTDAMDQLRKTEGWKRLHPNDSLPDLKRKWKIHEEGEHFGWAELRPDELETFESGSKSDAEKALARKVRTSLWELESTWNRYYQARMNANYYRKAAADCKGDKADSKDLPKPQPDTRFLDKRGGF